MLSCHARVPGAPPPQEVAEHKFAQLADLFRTLFLLHFCTNYIQLTHNMMSVLSALGITQ
jgi:hypothetical protein